MTKKENIINELVETGSDISGNISGVVIGGLIAGPAGAIVGGVSGSIITRVFKKIGSEIKQRFLSQREEIRIGAVYGFAINKLQENIKKGKAIRTDSFFETVENERNISEEIFEGIILGVQKEYEERKVKYLGNLYANICTNSEITREHSNQLIRTTNSLSYRQFCILQLLNEKWEESFNLNFKVRGLENRKIEFGDVIIEIRDLQQKGLISVTARLNDVDDNSSPIHLDDINISKQGRLFCEMLSLNEIQRDELEMLNELIKINK